jgi:hypothetical protein
MIVDNAGGHSISLDLCDKLIYSELYYLPPKIAM